MKRKRVLKIILLVGAIVVVMDFGAGLLFIERLTMSVRTYHPYYHHGLKPNCEAVEPWSRSNKFKTITNSLGFRDRAVRNVPLTTDKYRIVFIGDSFTEGVNVPYDETFAGRIDKSMGPAYDVLNAGVISYSAITEFYKIDYLVNHEGLKLNELFVFSDISDVIDDYTLQEQQHFVPHMKMSLQDRMAMVADRFMDNYSYLWHSYISIHTYIKSRKYQREYPWWTLKDEVYNDWGKIGLDISGTYMQKLADLCRENHIRLNIVVYPWQNLIKARDLHSRQVAFWSAFAKKNQIGFVNLFPYFINETPATVVIDRYFIPNDLHWNSAGHELVARLILKYIRERSTTQFPNGS